MKEIKQIVEAYKKIDFSKNKAALATVVRVEGSSYRRTGARMLVMESGEWIGGISGGCLEGDALKKARLAMMQNKATLITYDTTDDDPYQIGVGLGCNGIIDVLITPLDPANELNAVLQVSHCLEQRSPNVIVTVTDVIAPVSGHARTDIQLGQVFRYDTAAHFESIFPLETIRMNVIGEIETAMATTKSVSQGYTLSDGRVITLFIEVIPPPIQLYIFGSNYDIYPMTRVSKELGWKVIVVCNPAKMHPSLFTMADAVVPKDYQPVVDAYTAAISMCHDYESDYRNLQTLLNTDITYIGLLGPKKRTVKMYTRMEEEGKTVTITDEDRIFSPVGLDVGASTPEEIALSACAEIRAIFSGRDATNLKFRNKPIYES